MSEDVKVYAFKDIIFKRQNIPGVRLGELCLENGMFLHITEQADKESCIYSLKVLMPDKELKQYVGLNREELVDKINYWRNLEQK